jgi:hypothetical protein
MIFEYYTEKRTTAERINELLSQNIKLTCTIGVYAPVHLVLEPGIAHMYSDGYETILHGLGNVPNLEKNAHFETTLEGIIYSGTMQQFFKYERPARFRKEPQGNMAIVGYFI